MSVISLDCGMVGLGLATSFEAMEACEYRVINLEGTVPMRDAGASAHALALPRLHPGD